MAHTVVYCIHSKLNVFSSSFVVFFSSISFFFTFPLFLLNLNIQLFTSVENRLKVFYSWLRMYETLIITIIMTIHIDMAARYISFLRNIKIIIYTHTKKTITQERTRYQDKRRILKMPWIIFIEWFILASLFSNGVTQLFRWLIFASSVDWYLRLSVRFLLLNKKKTR